MAVNRGPADGFQEENIIRLPLSVALDLRLGRAGQSGAGLSIVDRDPAIINGYVDVTGNGIKHVVKRPGRRLFCNLNNNTVTAILQGMHYYNGRIATNTTNVGDGSQTLAVVFKDKLYINPSGNTITGEFVWTFQGTAPWAATFGGFSNRLQLIHLTSTNIIAIVSGRGGTDEVYRSIDVGVTWTLQTTSPGWVARGGYGAIENSSTSIFVMGGRNAAGTLLNDVWRSTDNGSTWVQQTAAAGWSARENFALVRQGTSLFVMGGTDAGGDLNDVWRSTDNGATWTLMTAAAPWAVRINAGATGGSSSSFQIAIAGGSTGATNHLDMWYSSNGTTWFRGTDSMPFSARAMTRIVATDPDRWIANNGSNTFAFAEVTSPNVWHQYSTTSTLNPINNAFALATGAVGIGSSITTIRAVSEGAIYDQVFTDIFPNGPREGIVFDGDVDLVHFEDVPLPDLNKSSSVPEGRTTANAPLEGFFLNSTEDAYFYNTRSRTLTKITSTNYPFLTVGGAAWLNGRFYIMTVEGRIYASGINDPYTWNALDFINAIMHSDRGMGVFRRHTYIMAMGRDSVEWFYDSGAAIGNPLRRVDSAAHDFGCFDSQTVVTLGDTTLFVGTTDTSREIGVYRLEGYIPKKVSTPFIDRLLSNGDFDCSWAYPLYHEGNRFYITGVCCLTFSLVYHLETDMWYLWTSTDAFVLDSPPTVTAALNTSTGLVDVTVLDIAMAPASVGDPIIVTGATQTVYNGSFVVSRVIDSDSFTYTLPTSTVPVTPATGTLLIRQIQEVTRDDWGTSMSVASSSTTEIFPLTFTYLLDRHTGNIYTVDNQVPTDRDGDLETSGHFNDSITSFIDFTIRTPRADMQNNVVKFISRAEVLGDNVAIPVLVRYSDDDYVTWSPYRQVDMSLGRARLSRQGSMRRRAYEIRQPYSQPSTVISRVEALELFYKQGSNV